MIDISKPRMKETAVTADLAKKAMENNMNIEEDRLLGFARSHIRGAQRICNEVGFMFDTLVDEARNEDKLIRMGRKYRTATGLKADIRFTNGLGRMPVVGYVDGDDDVLTWDRFGNFVPGSKSGYDLISDEKADEE